MRLRQVVPHEHWPSGDGRPLAVLRLEPAQLATRYGLRFDAGYDNLDAYQRAALAMPGGNQVWLVRHRGDPEPGTVAYVDAAQELLQAKAFLMQTLGLVTADFRWMAPGAADPVAATGSW